MSKRRGLALAVGATVILTVGLVTAVLAGDGSPASFIAGLRAKTTVLPPVAATVGTHAISGAALQRQIEIAQRSAADRGVTLSALEAAKAALAQDARRWALLDAASEAGYRASESEIDSRLQNQLAVDRIAVLQMNGFANEAEYMASPDVREDALESVMIDKFVRHQLAVDPHWDEVAFRDSRAAAMPIVLMFNP